MYIYKIDKDQKLCRVLIKYCIFSKDSKLFRTLAFLWFPSVSLYTVQPPGRQDTSAAAELAELRNITTF